MNAEQKLLPCPFCGNTKPEFYSANSDHGEVNCADCGASVFSRSPIDARNAWNTRPAPTEADVLAAAKRAAAANSSIHEGYDLELFWRLLDERAQAHWLKVARAALGVEGGDDGRG